MVFYEEILKLTPKQEQFCQEYLIDLNGTQAAIRAGYSPKTAKEQASYLLTNINIKNRVAELKAVRQSRVEITQDRVLQEYARLAFHDPRKFFDESGNLKNVTELDDDTAAALAGMDVSAEKSEDGQVSFTKKIKIADKKGALDSVARHLGMFNDKLAVDGNFNITMNKKIHSAEPND